MKSRRIVLSAAWCAAWCFSAWSASAEAAVEVIADYRLGSCTPQGTYAGGPAVLKDSGEKKNDLRREGNPR